MVVLVATELIRADPVADHHIGALSEQIGLSQRHLTRLFEHDLGTSPARFVEAVRIETACRLMRDDGLTILEVARRSGFGSGETMRRAFWRELGMPPRSYRQSQASS
jgi:transcriptional regulator GlxA family with amidase domain